MSELYTFVCNFASKKLQGSLKKASFKGKNKEHFDKMSLKNCKKPGLYCAKAANDCTECTIGKMIGVYFGAKRRKSAQST